MTIIEELRNKQSRDNRDLLDRAANEIERLQKLLSEKKISVQVPLGKITAEIGGDPVKYPEVFIYLKRKDGIEIDLVVVAQDSKNEGDLKAYLYDDTSTDSYGKTFTWHKEALLIEGD